MAVHKISKGLNLPIAGGPDQTIHDGPKLTRVAIMNDDYPFMKPRMHVGVGDKVKIGQLLFEDRKTEGVLFTSPAGGEIIAINRGERRKLQSVVVRVSFEEEEHIQFTNYTGKPVEELEGPQIQALLVESGLWTAFRKRPYSKVPSPTETCRSIFVTAIDTRPMAPKLDVILDGKQEDLERGLQALTKLTEGTVFFCKESGSKVNPGDVPGVQLEDFQGLHPAGLPGTHIHMLDPVSRQRSVWYIGIQDVVAMGRLLDTGKLDVERVISLGGPIVKNPRLLRTRLGASTDELVDGELESGENRVISGSVLAGRKAQGDNFGYLGRYDQQISCLAEDRERVFVGWTMPGLDKFSTVKTYVAGMLEPLMPDRKFNFTTTTNGSHRAMVPIGMFERVMPLDIMPTFLLRALLAGDLEHAEKLGALELDEEDLGLCSFVSPGKEDYGTTLRQRLTTIWKEG